MIMRMIKLVQVWREYTVWMSQVRIKIFINNKKERKSGKLPKVQEKFDQLQKQKQKRFPLFFIFEISKKFKIFNISSIFQEIELNFYLAAQFYRKIQSQEKTAFINKYLDQKNQKNLMSEQNEFTPRRRLFRKPASYPQAKSPDPISTVQSFKRSNSLKKGKDGERFSVPILDQCEALSDESLKKKYSENILFRYQVEEILSKVEKNIPAGERKKKVVKKMNQFSKFSTMKEINKEEDIRQVNFYVRCVNELLLRKKR